MRRYHQLGADISIVDRANRDLKPLAILRLNSQIKFIPAVLFTATNDLVSSAYRGETHYSRLFGSNCLFEFNKLILTLAAVTVAFSDVKNVRLHV